MSILSYCSRSPCTVGPEATLGEAARRMEKEWVGFLAVTQGDRLVGVLTDRDVALEVVAGGRNPSEARVGDVMTRPVVSGAVGESVSEVLARISAARVRRLPLLDDGRVQGVVSVDDLGLLLCREVGFLGDLLLAQLPADAARRHTEAAEVRGRPAGDHYRRNVVVAAAEARAPQVARRMRERGVGSVVVLDEDGNAVGLVTDRDLALRVVAAGLDPATTTAAAVMSTPLVSAHPSDPLEVVVARMRTTSVRRVPILEDGRPVGMVTFDDLVVVLARELNQLADCVAGEIEGAQPRSPVAPVRSGTEEWVQEALGRLRETGDQTLRTLGRELGQVVERIAEALRTGGSRERQRAPRVRDLMHQEVRTCTPEDALSEAARSMRERDCGCVPVVASDGSGRVVGMITDRDICMAGLSSGARLSELQVEQAMARRVFACHPDDPLEEAEAMMRAAQVRRLPVTDEANRLRGMLSLADIAESAAGLRAPGTVSAEEVGLLLEAICRPRNELVAQEAPDGRSRPPITTR